MSRNFFRWICSKCPLTIFAFQSMFQFSVALFCFNLRSTRATLHLKWGNLENMESSAEYFAGVFQKVVKLIPNCFKRSKRTPQWVRGSLEMWLSWYHTIFKTRNLPQNSLKSLKLIQNCPKWPNIPLYEL